MIKETFSNDIQLINFVAPFLDGVDRDRKLSTNFTLGEVYDATFMLPSEWEGVTEIPIHSKAIIAAQIMRSYLGKPITITSAFRSKAHDLSKGRSGTSQHIKANAIDLSGKGLSELLRKDLEEKGHIYRSLRSVGVNGIGLYDNFIHLDFRPAKISGEIYFWDNVKKKGDKDLEKEDGNHYANSANVLKNSNLLKYIWIPILFFLIRKPLFRFFAIKKKYKQYKTKFNL